VTLVAADLLARGATLGLLALWGWVLLRDHRDVLAARVALMLLATVACHILADMRSWDGSNRTLGLLILKTGQSAAPAAFWLFARTWFNDEGRVGWASWLMVGLAALVGGLLVIGLSLYPAQRLGLDIAQRVIWLGFVLAGLVIAYRGRKDDLVEERRRLRMHFVWSVGLYFLLVTASGFVSNWNDGAIPSFRIINLGIPILTAALCAALLGTRRAEFFVTPLSSPSQVAVPVDGGLTRIADAITSHMAAQKAWRDDGLTIARLAAALGEQEYRVRRAINQHMGYRNFAAFLNAHRLAEVKAALADPTQADVPIITIALDAGFGSLGPFNRAFREAEGVTPSAFRQLTMADSGIG
jgi:AraC-like DNA-binding protein